MPADVVDLGEKRTAKSRQAPEGWEGELRRNNEGHVKKTIANVELITTHGETSSCAIALPSESSWSKMITTEGSPPTLR
jgi:hypothetical protein